MDILRRAVETLYEQEKEALFRRTSADPEIAHEELIKKSRILHSLGLDRLLFNCRENYEFPSVKISNAAGFNKNGEIHPLFLKYMGFDIDIIGTITGDEWGGNPRSRTKRYPETGSLVNWMGLPGIGAERVAENVLEYGTTHNVPLTMNVMVTPGKKGDDACRDLEKSVLATRDLPFVYLFELNVSCPNTYASNGSIDARREHQAQLKDYLQAVTSKILPGQYVDVKVSPDLTEEDIEDTIEVAKGFPAVRGFTTTNTTRVHDPDYITTPPNPEDKGGASGNAVYELSKKTQETFQRKIVQANHFFSLIACGGIDSTQRALERVESPFVRGMQIYTPLIFKGPKLLRELRRMRI